MASKTVTRKKEVWIYPIESLISEFGGALGLFLGFSFMMIWDMMKVIMTSDRAKIFYRSVEC